MAVSNVPVAGTSGPDPAYVLTEALRTVLLHDDFEGVAGTLFGQAKDLIGAPAGYVALLSENGLEHESVFVDTGGATCAVDPSLPMRVRGLAREVYLNGRIVRVNGFESSDGTPPLPAGHIALRSVLLAPLAVGDKPIGIIGFANKPGGFTENDAEHAGFFGGIAAIALRNARTIQRLRESEARNETLLAESDARYRRLVEGTSDLVTVVDAEGRFVFVNERAAQLFGCDGDACVGRSSFGWVHPDDRERTRRWFEEALAARESTAMIENRQVAEDGSVHDVVWNSAFNYARDGSLVAADAIGRDVTDAKRAAAELALSEARLREAQRMAKVGNWEWHPATGYLYWSEENYRIFDLDPGVEPSMGVWTERLVPGEAERVGAAIEAALAGAPYELDMRIVHRDGSEHVLSVLGEVERDESGAPTRMFGTFQEVTEARAAEAALRASEALYHDLVETSQDLIWQCDADGRYRYLNPAWEQVLGRPLSEMLGHHFTEFQPSEAATRDTIEFGQLLVGGVAKGFETVHLAADGREMHLVFNAKRVLDESGAVVGTRGTAYDVTERKRAEIAIAHSRDLLKYVVEHARNAVAIHDKDLRYIYVSQRYLDEYGVKDRDVIGKHHYDVFPDLPEKWRIVHRKALRGEVSSAEDDPYEREDGSVDWTTWECRPWYEADGSIGGIIVYTAIVNERRRTELLLKDSEERYRTLVEQSPLAILVNRGGQVIYANRECIELFGAWSQEDVLGRSLTDLFVEESSATVMEAITGQAGPASGLRAQVRRLDGVKRDVQVAAAPFEQHGERLIHVVLRDITERTAALRDRAVYQQRVGELAAELLRSGDRERSRLAAELHDGVGQALVAAKMNAQQAASECHTPSVAESLRRLTALLDYSIEGVRTITADLSPPVLRSLGLGAAIDWLAETFASRFDLGCDVEVGDEAVQLKSDAAALAFRTARELLNNVQRHSGASRAELRVDAEGTELVIEVCDRGRGFEAGASFTVDPSAQRFGLFSINEELRLAGGTFELQSGPGEGTHAVARIPLDLDWAGRGAGDVPEPS